MRTRINRALAWRTSPSAIPTRPSSSPTSRSASTSRSAATSRCAGRTRIGHGARIDDGVHPDRHRGRRRRRDQALLRRHRRDASAPGASIGPFAHLRPGTRARPGRPRRQLRRDQEDRARARAARPTTSPTSATPIIGEKVNVGAGTITCNYDGYEKFQTVIEDGAFIGSDTQLVAPVRVGRRAVVAAGTTVTRDVPRARWRCRASPQIEKPGYAQKVAK